MSQIVLTPSAGKRLIAKATAENPSIRQALNKGTIVIIAGTTNGYVAEELLRKINQEKDFNRAHFFRGVTLPTFSIPQAQPGTGCCRYMEK